LVMNKGVIEESGYPSEIYNNPKTEYTKKLIDAIPKGNLEDIKANQLKRNKKENNVI